MSDETLTRAVFPEPAGGPELKAGHVIRERYRLKEMLGRGGFGVVWLADDENLHIPVAIKFLSPEIVHNPEAIEELKDETRLSLRLTHPHIVRIHGFLQTENLAGILMEYVDGGTVLAQKLQRPNRRLECSEIAPWIPTMCEALDYAHFKAKVVHRDLKPGNLMLDAAGELKIADFGISSSISDTHTRLTMGSGAISGTPAYMSPQHLIGKRPQVTDDIYALGATLYDLITGKPPFYTGDILEQLRTVVPPSLADRREELAGAGDEIPPEWEATIAICLNKEASDRPASAGEVAERLGLKATTKGLADTATRGYATPREAPSVAPPSKPRRRGPPVLAGLAIAAVLIVGFAVNRARAPRTDVAPAETAAAADLSSGLGDAGAAGAGPAGAAADIAKEPSAAQSVVTSAVAPAPEATPPPQQDKTIAIRRKIPVLMSRREWDEAEAQIGALLKIRPDDEDGQLWRSEVQRAREVDGLLVSIPAAISAEQWSEAQTRIDRFVSLAPSDPRVASWRSEVENGRAARPPTPPPLARNTPPDQTPTPAPDTEPAPVRTAEEEIRLLLQRYERALETLDANGYAALWASLSNGKRKEIETSFKQFRSQTMDLSVEQIAVDGEDARVRITEQRRVVPVVGAEMSYERAVLMKLRKSGSDWLIDELN